MIARVGDWTKRPRAATLPHVLSKGVRMSNSKQRLANVMLGVHLGDALGVPFECMTRQEILDATGGFGVDRPRFDLKIERKIDDTRDLPPGSTSDDSQLANAVADGLIMGDGYVHELQVLLHLKALWNDVSGWGRTTKRGLYEIDKWYRERRKLFAKHPPPAFKKPADRTLWEAAQPRDPAHPAQRREKARGNGPSMKIAPLAAFMALRGRSDVFASGEALMQILEFSRITHGDPLCAVAAYAVASVVHDLVRGFGPEGAFTLLKARVETADVQLNLLHKGRDRFSYALHHALSLSGKPEELWAFGSKGIADSLNTVPLALAIWYRHCEDQEPTAAVLEAINAGGDTDTVASMVGAMMGAMSDDRDWWPFQWKDCLQNRGVLARQLGFGLAVTAARTNAPCPIWERQSLLRELGYL